MARCNLLMIFFCKYQSNLAIHLRNYNGLVQMDPMDFPNAKHDLKRLMKI